MICFWERRNDFQPLLSLRRSVVINKLHNFPLSTGGCANDTTRPNSLRDATEASVSCSAMDCWLWRGPVARRDSCRRRLRFLSLAEGNDKRTHERCVAKGWDLWH